MGFRGRSGVPQHGAAVMHWGSYTHFLGWERVGRTVGTAAACQLFKGH